MTDDACVRFLQQHLPSLGLRWSGYRKVRGTVCKRLSRRLRELGLDDLEAYRDYLASHNQEWSALDAFCRIPISRFYRDRGVFDALRLEIIPGLAERAKADGRNELNFWSAGAASGEEAYTLALIWHLEVVSSHPEVTLRLFASDAEDIMRQRARRAVYASSSLRDLPDGWRDRAFAPAEGGFRLKAEFRRNVTFALQDIRSEMPGGPFDLIACRNLVFTYFSLPLQRQLLHELANRLREGAILVIGGHERLPETSQELESISGASAIYRRTSRECRL